MKRLAAALLAAAPLTAAAEGGPSDEAVARFVAAVERAGCTLTPDNQAQVLQAAKLPETEAEVIASVLTERGEAAIEDGKLRVTTGACG